MKKIKVLETTFKRLEELAFISFKLRFYTKLWQTHYGALNKSNMVTWQNKMDEWLAENTEEI